ncbi:MAG: beta-glycosidase-like protein [Limisphaerales bacterium]|nr:MAG: beta-glycosidase-like protein [Limisphaerales bacterium]
MNGFLPLQRMRERAVALAGTLVLLLPLGGALGAAASGGPTRTPDGARANGVGAPPPGQGNTSGVDPALRAQRQKQVEDFLAEQERTASPPPAIPQVVERGAHHNRWETYRTLTNAVGRREVRTNSYVELATGVNRLDAGQWVPARALIELAPGGAEAKSGSHQVNFGANANRAGFLEVNTPDGKRLRSHVLGLFYLETTTGRSVQISSLKNSPGAIHPPNEVVYADAFKELKADLRYTYRLSGIEQDVILRERPPNPADFGLDPVSSQLVVMTEFLDAPEPARKVDVLKKKLVNGREVDGLQDETLEFGAMKMGPGRAFQLGEQGNLLPGKSDSSVPVGKRWLKQGGRVFLLEAVEYPDLQPFLPQLPRRPQAWNRRPVMKLERLLATCAPPQRELPNFRGRMQVASLPLSGPGLVVDYNLGGTLTNFTFQGDTTYYVSGDVTLNGTTTIEGGAVVKYSPTNTSYLLFHGPLLLKTSEYRPAVFTIRDDDTVGETISGSTGNPTNYYHGAMCFNIVTTEPLTLEHMRFAYANYAVAANYRGLLTFRNIQVMNCFVGLWGGNAGMKVLNSLIANTTYAVVGDNYQQPILVENSTFNACSNVFYAFGSGDVRATNNIFASVTTYGSYSNLTANYNGIYDSPALSQANGFTATSNPFQIMGGGGYYLPTNSAWRNVGSAAIDPLTTAAIQQRTTEPPLLVSGWINTNAVFGKRVERDVDTPDLGYHYAALDYVFAATAPNTGIGVTIQPGVSVGVVNPYTNYAYYGIYINPNAGLNRWESAGLPTERNRLVMFNAVQESASTFWNQNIDALIVSSGSGTLSGGCRFTDFVVMGTTNIGVFRDYSSYPDDSFRFEHCHFQGGRLEVKGHTIEYHSCLFDRTTVSGTSWGANTFRNCTFIGGSASFSYFAWWGGVSVYDSLFDGTAVSGTPTAHGWNGYTTNSGSFTRLSPAQTNDVLVDQAGFVAGPLGSYYLTNGNAIVNAGSQTAAAAGLYHFTTATNQVKETNSTVDIGYHYVALNTNGLPLDTDGDGLPDHFEDRNGNGTVDAGETSWLLWSTAGNGLSDAYSDLDYDGVWAIDEHLDGTDPTDPNSYVLRPRRLGLWRFHDTNWLGEQGQVPLFTTNAQNIISWSGRGLQVGTNDSWRFLTYRDVETNGSPNINLREGSVRFWFKPNWASTNASGTGPGTWGRLVSVGWFTYDGSVGFWDLQFHPEGNQITFNGFDGQTNYGVGYLAANISFHSNQWHQITLTYSPSSSALYIDGQLVQTGSGITAWPNASMRATTGFSIGNDYYGGQTVNGQFRDFETFNYPLAASEIAKPLALGAGTFLSGGQFQLQVGGGISGSNWTVQASSDLLNWTAVTNITATGGNVTVVDAGATNYPYRFYRARNGCDRSVNVFGYLRKTVPTGDSMISIPFNGANNGVPSHFSSAPPGSSVFKYNPASGGFESASYAFGTWSGNLTLNPGEGVSFRNSQTNATTLTFIGEIPEGHIVTPIGTNFGIYGSAVPLGGRLEAVLGLPVASALRLDFWNNATTNYSVYQYYSGLGWFPSAPPSVAVGDAFWVSGFPQGTNWVQDFFPPVAIASPYDNTVFLQPTNLTLTASVTNECQVAQVNYYSGTNWLGAAATSPYTLVWSNALAGIHYLTARATDLLGNISTSRVVEILVDPQPTVTLIAPAANALIPHGNAVSLTASATNFYAAISNVAYYVSNGTSNTLIGTTSVGPSYMLTWWGSSNATTITNWLTARATDIHGAMGTSAPVTILLDKRPNITLTSPTNGTVVTAPGNLTLNATATDADGTIQSVDFYANGTLLAHIPALPGTNYSFPWMNIPAGTNVVTAVATDNLSLTSTSAPVTVTIDVPPTLAFVSPGSNGMVYAAPATIPVTVTATDPDGQVARLAFYHGPGTNAASATNSLGVVTNTAPYTNTFSVSWTNNTVGNYVIRVVATDNLGVTTTVTRTIQVAVPPAVALTSPASGAVYALPAGVPLVAVATSTNGVDRVEFLAGTTVVGTVTNAPYEFTWNSPATGTNTFSARVTDRLGLVATSTSATNVVVEPNWTVSLATSANGLVAVAPTNVTLTASVVSNLMGIVQVEFFVNGTNSLGVDTSSPYGVVWTNATAGTNWLITARATNLGGIVRTSAPVTLVVDAPTTVSLTGVTNDAIVRWAASLPLTAVATNTLVGIQQVEFFQGLTSTGVTNSLGVSTNTGNPYGINWASAPAGTNYLTAVASNRLGVVTTAAVVRVVVDVPPTVALTSPTNSQMFTPAPATITVTGVCASPNGTVTNVAIFQGTGTNNLLVNLASPGTNFSHAWSNVVGGIYLFRAVATDNLGVSTESAWVTNVVVNGAVTVAITNPASGAVYVPPTLVVVGISATDPENSITNVTLKAGTNVLAVWGNGPCSYTWTNAPLGTNILRAEATDGYGVTSVSAEVTVIVEHRPWVTLVSPTNNAVLVTPVSPALVVQAGTTNGVGVAQVEFFSGTNSLGVVTNNAPYTNTAFALTWTNPAVGHRPAGGDRDLRRRQCHRRYAVVREPDNTHERHCVDHRHRESRSRRGQPCGGRHERGILPGDEQPGNLGEFGQPLRVCLHQPGGGHQFALGGGAERSRPIRHLGGAAGDP